MDRVWWIGMVRWGLRPGCVKISNMGGYDLVLPFLRENMRVLRKSSRKLVNNSNAPPEVHQERLLRHHIHQIQA